jgi:hypothetical protein
MIKMINKQSSESEGRILKIIKKIALWLIVISVTIMLIVLLIIQPRFYTFLD